MLSQLSGLESEEGLPALPASLVPTLAKSVVQVGAVAALLLRYDPVLAALCLGGVSVDTLVAVVYAQHLQRFQSAKQHLRSEVNAAAGDMVGHHRTCKVHGAAPQKLEDLVSRAQALTQLQRRKRLLKSGAGVVQVLVPQMLSILMFCYAAGLMRCGRLTVADLMAVQLYQQAVSRAFSKVSDVAVSYGVIIGQSRGLIQVPSDVTHHSWCYLPPPPSCLHRRLIALK